MKAVRCVRHGPPEALVVEDIAAPAPGPGEVLVAVKAAGVNFPDTLIIQDKYQFKPALPFTPGGELAGVVQRGRRRCHAREARAERHRLHRLGCVRGTGDRRGRTR